jgi:hypothetical protein
LVTTKKKLLSEVSAAISQLKVGQHKSLILFQKGILLTNRSLANMYDYLQQKYSCDYILTFRLNQDVLEKIFAYIRGMGGSNDHPAPLDFQYRLKWFILGKNSASVLTNNQNTSSQSTKQCFLKVDDCIAADDGHPVELCVTQELFANIVTEPPVQFKWNWKKKKLSHTLLLNRIIVI